MEPNLLANPGVWDIYAVTVCDVEALTGYNFFSELLEQLHNAIETRHNTDFVLNVALLADTETQFLSLSLQLLLPHNEFPSIFEEFSIGQGNVTSNNIVWIKSNGSGQINSPYTSINAVIPYRPLQIDVPHVTPREGDVIQLSASEIGSFQIDRFQESIVERGLFQVNSLPASIVGLNKNQIGTRQISPFQVNFVEDAIPQFSSAQVSPTQVRSFQISALAVNSGQISSTQINPTQVSPTKVPFSGSVATQQLLSSYISHTSTTQLISTFETTALNLLESFCK